MLPGMDLLEAIRKEVLKQKEEEALNFFSTVGDFCEFITTANTATDVSVTVKMTCWMSERVNGDHGTRVTLIDANQRAFFNLTVEALGELTVVKRKPYIAQIMVWDAKANKGVSGFGSKPGMVFRPGAVYVFLQVDGVGFYADIAKGAFNSRSEMRKRLSRLLLLLRSAKPTCGQQEESHGQDTARGDKPDFGA
ncbi:hypothetical protein GQ600_323 [Phytophthora cactorum]|nr:hypothetical protein GQ600_323 [Phytophthora cactorum]